MHTPIKEVKRILKDTKDFIGLFIKSPTGWIILMVVYAGLFVLLIKESCSNKFKKANN